MDESIMTFDQNPGGGGQPEPWRPSNAVRIGMVVALLVLGALSFFLLGPRLSAADTYTTTIAALDAMREGGVAQAIIEGAKAASRRSKELS